MQLKNLHYYTLETLLSKYPDLQVQVNFGLQKNATDILKLYKNTVLVNYNTYLADEFLEILQLLPTDDKEQIIRLLNNFYSRLVKLKYTQDLNLQTNVHNQLLSIISHTTSNLTRYIAYKLKAQVKITSSANYLPIQFSKLNQCTVAVSNSCLNSKNSCLNGKIFMPNFGIQISIYTSEQQTYTNIDNTNSILIQIRDMIKKPIYVRVFLLTQAQNIKDILNNTAGIGINEHLINKTFYLYPY